MIEAIIPIPNRHHDGDLIGIGFDNNVACVSGRAIQALPLCFYKFYSRYGNSLLQHIFASDSIITPTTLNRSRNIFTGVDEGTGGTLVPISVKRVECGHATTFLFPRCIDFLLRSYKRGVPLREADVLTLGNYSELAPKCTGVVGVSEFNFKHLGNFMMMNNWCGLSNRNRLIMSTMTPELPETISTYADEIISLRLFEGELAQYISDLGVYESGNAFSIKEYLESKKYEYAIDPLTAQCIATPSYIFGKQLQFYLGDEIMLRNYHSISTYHEPDNKVPLGEIFMDVNPRFQTDDPYTWSNAFMEELINIADDGFNILIDSSGAVRDTLEIVPGSWGATSYPLAKCVYSVFKQFRSILIHKTWTEEVCIKFVDYSGFTNTYYINLAWYHLISPSLINTNLVR